MKNNLLLLILFLLLSLTIKAQHTPDSIFTRQYIQNISFTNPQKALKILDEAEKDNRMAMHHINHLRTLVYHNGLSQYRIALDYGLKAWQSDSIRNNPELALQLINLIADEYMNIGNYTECIRFTNIGATIARQIGDKNQEANMLMSTGSAKYEMGLKKDAVKCFLDAIEIQKKEAAGSQSWGLVDDLIYSYGTLVTAYLDDGEYQQVIDLLPEFERLMKQLENCTDLPDGFVDMRYAGKYAAFASTFALNGELEKARQYYEKYLQTDISSTPEGEYMRIEYLMNIGNYQEALYYVKREKQHCIDNNETDDYEYVNEILDYEARCYMGLKNYRAAAENYEKMFAITDSLKSNERQNMALELATIYETNEKSRQITEQKSQLHQSRIIVITSVCMLFLAIIILWLITHNLKVTRKKNKIMADQIDELLINRDELLKAKEEIRALSHIPTKKSPLRAATANSFSSTETQEITDITEPCLKSLFEELETLINKEFLFLDPDINRDMLIKRLHIPKNALAQIIQTYAHTNFNGYINKKRLEYSILRLKDYHNYTIQTVAIDSGFSNVRTFYRTFREKYGMTPAEYRETLTVKDKVFRS